ncbi:hypothetical protein A9995_15185 [Erythrobacter sp. QSSC1-22B]|uniref:heavy-metal-associated domain-containing protein n=1 Tax=Erythrobacter sp. QSSC1-22B TaxID=1860125 RepID=UPI0008056FE1|nr:heavy-metal-associated domain-containing protein [Erythrobacter sp. QSSC1-22B]OBX17725.1 hypothetical protein A9995_15185 [Erythrobacter sp. QSSC1-22B]
MIRFQVSQMTCGGCARSVTNAVKSVDPDAKVEVDIPAGTVAIDGDASEQELVAVIREAGYEPSLAR